jgi:hypothetical protein
MEFLHFGRVGGGLVVAILTMQDHVVDEPLDIGGNRVDLGVDAVF